MFTVIDDICCLHAQLISSAELSLWARLTDLRATALDSLLWEDRQLVKTWAQRGTLHLIPADSYPRWQAALSAYRHYLKGAWLKAYGVTDEELEEMLPAIGEALMDTLLTREELASRVAEVTGSDHLKPKLSGDSWGSMLKPASFRGYLCFAPNLGQKVRFTNPHSWLGEWKPVPADEAMAEATRRYLAAYGPATREDYARWWGHTPASALKLIKSIDDAVEVEIDGAHGWMLAEDASAASEASPSHTVNLLPAFDPWIIGATRVPNAQIAEVYRNRVYRPQGWVSPVVLVDGHMAGVWKHEIKRDNRVIVEVSPFEEFPAWVRHRVKEEAQRLAEFFSGTIELSWL